MKRTTTMLHQIDRPWTTRIRQRALWEFQRKTVQWKLNCSLRSTRQLTSDSLALFFVPEAAVTPHLALCLVLAKTLKEMGYAVAMARCFKLFDRCPTKGMNRLPLYPTQKVIDQNCIHCVRQSITLSEAYGLPSLDLRTYDTNEVQRILSEEMSGLSDPYLEYSYDGVNFGRITANDLSLTRKVYRFDNASEETQIVWRQYIHSILKSYLIMKECLGSQNVHTLIYYNDYATNIGAQVAVKNNGGKTFCISHAAHMNVDRRRPIFFRNIGGALYWEQFNEWDRWKNVSLPASTILEIANDTLNNIRSQGMHIYSPSKKFFEKDSRQILGITPNRKVVVVFTSSLDEMESITHLLRAFRLPSLRPPQPFTDQIDWLSALVDYTGKRSDLELWIRVHPREGKTERNAIEAEHLLLLKSHFSKPNPNVHFVWPENPLSSYDLAELAHVVLTSWSSIGLEMARMGIPVIATTNNEVMPLPDQKFIHWVSRKDSYFHLLDETLNTDAPASLDRILQAVRWYHLVRLAKTIDIGDVIPHSHYTELPNFHLPMRAKDIERVLIKDESILDINFEILTGRKEASAQEERSVMISQLGRYIHFLTTGEDATPDLIQASAVQGRVNYIHNGRVVEKYSPLVARLVLAYNNEKGLFQEPVIANKLYC